MARLNMSHGDHASHQKTIDLVREYNAQFDDKIISIMLDTKVYLILFVLSLYSSINFSLQAVSHFHFSKCTSLELLMCEVGLNTCDMFFDYA